MNILLLKSSLLFGIPVILTYIYTIISLGNFMEWEKNIGMIGAFTSIINHYFTSNIAKSIDRIFMIYSACLYFYLEACVYSDSLNLFLLIFSIYLFIISKVLQIHIIHAMAHFTISVLNIKLLTCGSR